MKTYKYETHAHTSEVSACGSISAKELVKALYKKGYQGVIITDHFYHGNCGIDRRLPWEEWVDAYCTGYEAALEAAKTIDFDVFFGIEYNDREGTEFGVYGIDKEFLKNNDDMIEWSREKFAEEVRKAGGFITHVHPFRIATYHTKVSLYPELIDAVEVENASHHNPEYNNKALAYARQYGFPMTKGSDVHYFEDIKTGMVFKRRAKDIFDLIEMIKMTRY